MAKDTIGDSAFEIGADALGELVGAGVGGAVGGPVGAVGGAILGNAVSHTLISVKEELLGGLLSSKEQQRIVTVADMTKSVIERNLGQGKIPRDDGFFEGSVNERSSAEEIFEGTLITAQREYEERKLPLLANLNASTPTPWWWSRATACTSLRGRTRTSSSPPRTTWRCSRHTSSRTSMVG